MVNLTTPIAIPNVTKYETVAFDVRNGVITLRFYFGGGQTRLQDFVCVVSDIAGASSGVVTNPNPGGVGDVLTQKGGIGSVNSLANAQAAYRGAANHVAGLKALELRGVTDGWLGAEMIGS